MVSFKIFGSHLSDTQTKLIYKQLQGVYTSFEKAFVT